LFHAVINYTGTNVNTKMIANACCNKEAKNRLMLYSGRSCI